MSGDQLIFFPVEDRELQEVMDLVNQAYRQENSYTNRENILQLLQRGDNQPRGGLQDGPPVPEPGGRGAGAAQAAGGAGGGRGRGWGHRGRGRGGHQRGRGRGGPRAPRGVTAPPAPRPRIQGLSVNNISSFHQIPSSKLDVKCQRYSRPLPRILAQVEAEHPVTMVGVVSCRTDILPWCGDK